MGEKKQSSYTRYKSEHCETKTSENRYELVKKLLGKLPDNEQTVIILHYLGKMTTEEISKFLDVSVSIITSRLQQAHKFLQKDEVLLIQEVLGSTQISESIIENIMRQIPHLKP